MATETETLRPGGRFPLLERLEPSKAGIVERVAARRP